MNDVYYNDNDPKICAWLRELMADGLIPPGDVDDRSICDVQGSELTGYEQVHLFAGIGGWAYALQLAGWEAPVWTGSCPCQPFSAAGKRKAEADERHLWPAFFRLIAECRPPVVLGEQVSGKLGRKWLAGVYADLDSIGYRVPRDEQENYEFYDLPAAGVGAPHIRQRLYWVADSTTRQRRSGAEEFGALPAVPADLRITDHADRSSSAGRLADADGRNPGTEGLQRGRQHRQRPEDDGTGERLADAEDANWRGFHRGAQTRSQGRQVSQDRGCGTAGRLADAGRCGRRLDEQERGQEGRTTDRRVGEGTGRLGNADPRRRAEDQAVSRCAPAGAGLPVPDGGLPDAIGAGLARRQKQPARQERPAVERGGDECFWRDSRLIPCRDGKARRIPTEPALFPLAHGLPGRVGLLRGAGNAICPQVAAIFVMAFMEARR